MRVREEGAAAPESSGPATWMFDLVPALAAASLVLNVVRGFLARRTHPFDLEWMEGGMLAHAWRIVHGLPLYPEPGPEWIPYVYPPGYAAVLAALSPVFGLDYTLGRTVSILGTLAAGAAIVWMAGRRGQWLAGWVAAACFLGCWRASGAFYDLVRPDGLGTALLAWSLAIALERPRSRGLRRWTPEIAGLILCAAFIVKHHTAAFGFPLAFALWTRDGWRSAARFGVASAVPAGLFTLGMEFRTSGRFLEYLLAVPGSHPIDFPRIVPGTPGELGSWLLPSLVAGAAWIVLALARDLSRRQTPLRYGLPIPALLALPVVFAAGGVAAVTLAPEVRGVAMPQFPVTEVAAACIGAGIGAALTHLVAIVNTRLPGDRVLLWQWWAVFAFGGVALVVSTLMRGHYGGFLNVLMPAHFAICLGLAWVVVDVRRRWPGLLTGGLTAALLVLQVVWIAVQLEVDEILPTDGDREAGASIVARIRECPDGPIFSPYAPWLPVQAGRAPSPHLIAIWDIDHDGGPFRDGVTALVSAAKDHYWPCVVHGGRQPLGFGVDPNYEKAQTFELSAKAMMPKTGWRVRPSTLLVPKSAP